MPLTRVVTYICAPLRRGAIHMSAMEAAGSPGGSRSLAGLRVLIVEDDYFVANECAVVLREQGANVLGPVPDATRGREIITEETPDCVLLDVNLKGDFAFELASELLDLRIPVISPPATTVP